MDLFAGWLIVQMSREDAQQAQPWAPVRPDRGAQWRDAVRRRSALVLHGLADRLDPVCNPAGSFSRPAGDPRSTAAT
jgi:hypothetical protein